MSTKSTPAAPAGQHATVKSGPQPAPKPTLSGATLPAPANLARVKPPVK